MQRSFEIIKRRRPFGKWGYELLKKITIKSGFDKMITFHWSGIPNLGKFSCSICQRFCLFYPKTNTEVDRHTEKTIKIF